MKKLLLIALAIAGCGSPTINSNTDFKTVMMTDEVGDELGIHGDGVYSECFTGNLYRNSTEDISWRPTEYNIVLPYPNPTNGGISTKFTTKDKISISFIFSSEI